MPAILVALNLFVQRDTILDPILVSFPGPVKSYVASFKEIRKQRLMKSFHQLDDIIKIFSPYYDYKVLTLVLSN